MLNYVGFNNVYTVFNPEYIGTTTNTGNLTTYTFSSAAIGSADRRRMVVVAIEAVAGVASRTLSSVTIGGSSATVVSTAGGSGMTVIAGFAYLAVETGTTANIVVTFSGNMNNCAISVYKVHLTSYTSGLTIYNLGAIDPAPPGTSLSISCSDTANSVIAGHAFFAAATKRSGTSGATWSWSGFYEVWTEGGDVNLESGLMGGSDCSAIATRGQIAGAAAYTGSAASAHVFHSIMFGIT